jgi:protein-tyrosine phosphatase
LVHCAMGKSRSSAVLISFVMHETGLNYDDALAIVQKARPVVGPNPAFSDQLKYMFLSGDIRRSS